MSYSIENSLYDLRPHYDIKTGLDHPYWMAGVAITLTSRSVDLSNLALHPAIAAQISESLADRHYRSGIQKGELLITFRLASIVESPRVEEFTRSLGHLMGAYAVSEIFKSNRSQPDDGNDCDATIIAHPHAEESTSPPSSPI